MPLLSRRWLREHRRALNKQDADLIARLLEGKQCMHRIIARDGIAYSYCGKPATHYAAGGRVQLCESHREQ
jgi:hypothetical protein